MKEQVTANCLTGSVLKLAGRAGTDIVPVHQKILGRRG